MIYSRPARAKRHQRFKCNELQYSKVLHFSNCMTFSRFYIKLFNSARTFRSMCKLNRSLTTSFFHGRKQIKQMHWSSLTRSPLSDSMSIMVRQVS